MDGLQCHHGLGQHWGLTGTAFNGMACSINAGRCTWTEMLAYLNDGGDDARMLTATVSKGGTTPCPDRSMP